MNIYAAWNAYGDLICDGLSYADVEDACLDMGYLEDEFIIGMVTP